MKGFPICGRVGTLLVFLGTALTFRFITDCMTSHDISVSVVAEKTLGNEFVRIESGPNSTDYTVPATVVDKHAKMASKQNCVTGDDHGITKGAPVFYVSGRDPDSEEDCTNTVVLTGGNAEKLYREFNMARGFEDSANKEVIIHRECPSSGKRILELIGAIVSFLAAFVLPAAASEFENRRYRC